MEEKNTKKINGARAVLLSLLEENVDTIFGYPGGAVMPIYDELFDYENQLNHILVRHEQGAAHAAQSYAQVTGKVGVCFTTSGPGATNLITGIANAHVDSVPMVFITAQVPSKLLGTDAFQETDMVGLSMPVTKWNYQITKPEEIPDAFAKAFYIAVSGRPGPVLLDITKDAQFGELNFFYNKSPKLRSYSPYPKLATETVEKAAEMINQAKKPMILAGHGVLIARAENELIQFIDKTGIPVASTLLGLTAVPTEHPLYTGMLGMHGNYGPNVKTNEADLIIAIGMRFDDRVTGALNKYAKQAKIIHIEIDAAEINKNVEVTLPINADLRTVITRLIPRVNKRSFPNWLAEFKECDKKEFAQVIKPECYPEGEQIRMGEVVRKVSEETDGQAIVITDVGQQQMIGARYYRFKKPNSFITSGGLGTMGFGLPAAVGAKVGQTKRPVIAFVGDGGFQMTLQELGTIMQYQLGVKTIIMNNNFLGMVRQWQDMFFKKRYASTPMVTPDFVTIAKGYKINAKRVITHDELDAAIKEMFADDKPYLLEVAVEKEANIFPMIPPGAGVAEILLG